MPIGDIRPPSIDDLLGDIPVLVPDLGFPTNIGNALQLGPDRGGCTGLEPALQGGYILNSDAGGASPVGDILMPGGKPIGEPGSRPGIRVLPGGEGEALGLGGELIGAGGGTEVQLPGYEGVG